MTQPVQQPQLPQLLLLPQPHPQPKPSVPKSRIRMMMSQRLLLQPFPQNMLLILSPCGDLVPAGHGSKAGHVVIGVDGEPICAIICPPGAGGYNAREYAYV